MQVSSFLIILATVGFIHFNNEVIACFTSLEKVQGVCEDVLPYFSLAIIPDAW